jgi:DNA-binding transcriptional LysR family regulator
VLDIDLLRTFVALSETGSFTAAAEVVGRTQSAVSLQIRKLEDQVGHPLVSRLSHGIALTAQGETLLSHARHILQAHEDALAAFAIRRGQPNGLVLGISADYGQTLLPRVLKILREAYPNVAVEVVCGPSTEIAAGAIEGQVDLAFVGEGEALGQSPVVHRERLVWATGGDAHRRTPVPLALVPRECLYRRWATERLDAVGRRYRIAYTSRSIGGIQAIVRGGLAVTAIAESALVPGMEEIDEAEGFPALPPIEVRVERCRAKDSAELRDIEATLVEALTQRRRPATAA